MCIRDSIRNLNEGINEHRISFLGATLLGDTIDASDAGVTTYADIPNGNSGWTSIGGRITAGPTFSTSGTHIIFSAPSFGRGNPTGGHR